MPAFAGLSCKQHRRADRVRQQMLTPDTGITRDGAAFAASLRGYLASVAEGVSPKSER